MSNATSLQYFNPKMHLTDHRCLTLIRNHEGVAEVTYPVPRNSCAITFWDVNNIDQATIDAHLGTTDEFLVSQFATVTTGGDQMVILINMGGQVLTARGASFAQAGVAGTVIRESSADAVPLLDASVGVTQVQTGEFGNLGMICQAAGISASTDATQIIEILWEAV